MSELFGAPSGQIAFNQDQDQQVQTMQRFVEMQHSGALTEEAKVRTQGERIKIQREEQMLQLLAKGGSKPAGQTSDGSPLTSGEMLEDLGTRMVEGGFFKEGGSLLSQASQVRSREATAKHLALISKIELSDRKVKRMDSLNNFLAASNDEESFAGAKMAWLQENPGEEIPPALQNYDPNVIEALKKVTKTGQEEARRDQAASKEKDMKEYRKDSEARRERHDRATEAHMKVLESLRERGLEMRKKNAGAKAATVGSAKRDEVTAAQAMIMRDFPEIEADMPLGKEMVSSASFDLANEAKALMARNRGLSMPEAMTQVYARMKESGDFRITPKEPTVLQKLTKRDPGNKTTYKPGEAPLGATADKAAPLPPKGQPLKDGSYYVTPKGVVKWNAAKGKAEVVDAE